MKTILVVDDDRDQADLLSQFLSSNYNVITEYSFVAAKKMLSDNKTIDVLIADYDLRDGFGTDLYTSGQGAPKHHILISGKCFEERPGFDLCLTKPILLSDFFPRLAALIA
jgi:DNA-binding NtrC family response regulator